MADVVKHAHLRFIVEVSTAMGVHNLCHADTDDDIMFEERMAAIEAASDYMLGYMSDPFAQMTLQVRDINVIPILLM